MKKEYYCYLCPIIVLSFGVFVFWISGDTFILERSWTNARYLMMGTFVSAVSYVIGKIIAL